MSSRPGALAPAFAGQPAAWTQPAKPFRILDNIYYVGTKGLASYLIVSDGEAILLDGTLAENAGHIEDEHPRRWASSSRT